MNLIQDNRLKQKYKGFPRSLYDVSAIIVHGTGGGESSKAVIDWMSSETCERAEMYKQGIGLFPYSINWNGDIYNLMPVMDWYYHSDAGNFDRNTIGIELLNKGIGNSQPYTDAQYTALFELIKQLINTFPGIAEIRSHDANRRIISNLPPKPCPGPLFEWSRLEEFITNEINKTMTMIRG
jgi:hypothetical protein